MQKIISNTKELMNAVPKKTAKENKQKMEVLKEYIKSGGILRVTILEEEFPVIIYPTKKMLNERIQEKGRQLESMQKKRNDWNKRLIKAKTYKMVNAVKKLYSPIYWKHLVKNLTDSEYREHSKKVQLPVELTADEKWQPMIKMFVEDEEYRRQLVETVENSIVYKKNKKVGTHVEKINSFRITESEKNLNGVKQKVDGLKQEVKVLKELNALVR